jgi:hypothetical protein
MRRHHGFECAFVFLLRPAAAGARSLPDAGRRRIRFAALGTWSGAARGGGDDGRTDRGRRHFRARSPVFKGLRDDFPPPRRAARASLASRRRPIEGLSVLSPRRQAFPSISKFFQGNSKEIPNFSKDFQTFSLAVSREIKGLSVG